MAKEKFDRSKPHVNVGTIGHIDHGKTTLTAALTKVAADKGWAKFVPYDEVAKASESQGRRDDTKILTIATSHVEYQHAEAALRARRLPGPRRLHQEHDHGRRADGRRDPGRERGRRPDAADARARAARQAGQRAVPRRRAEQGATRSTIPELLDLVELEVRDLLKSYGFPGDDLPVVRVSALKALQGDPDGVESVLKLMEALDTYIPLPQREIDKPFLMPIEDVFSISGRGTVVTGRVERGKVKVGEEIEIVGYKPTEKKIVTGVEMFRKLLDEGVAGDNIGVLLRGVEKEDVERGQVLAKPRLDQAAHEVQGRGVHPLEGRGRPSHAVLQRLPSAVLHPDDRRHRHAPSAGRRRDGDAGRQHADHGELLAPVALEKGSRFAIREGGRTVGAGTITEIIE